VHRAAIEQGWSTEESVWYDRARCGRSLAMRQADLLSGPCMSPIPWAGAA